MNWIYQALAFAAMGVVFAVFFNRTTPNRRKQLVQRIVFYVLCVAVAVFDLATLVSSHLLVALVVAIVVLIAPFWTRMWDRTDEERLRARHDANNVEDFELDMSSRH